MARKTYTAEFKESAMRLVTEEKYPLRRAAENLGVDESTLRFWLRSRRRGDATAVAEEDRQLRRRVRELEREVQQLRVEREILKKAAAFFAREQP